MGHRFARRFSQVPAGLVALSLMIHAPGASAETARTKPEKVKPKPLADASDEASATLRKRIAALALKQVQFGSISLLPVRFESSRLAGPFEDGGRTIYCVSSHMHGRTFHKAERPKVVMREDQGTLTVLDDDEVCSGQRTKPFLELDTVESTKE